MKLLRKAFNERNLVIILFVLVFAAFSFAQKETKKLGNLYLVIKLHTDFSPRFTVADKTSQPMTDRSRDSGKKD
jgi:hypothetical protein